MFYLAGQSAYARAAWTAQVRGLERLRDGTQTVDWLKDLKANELDILKGRIQVDESTFITLDPANRKVLLNKLLGDSDNDRAKSDEGIRQEVASLFWNTGQRTLVKKDGEKRTYSVINDENAQKANPPGKLLKLDDPEIATWAKKLGPAGFTKLVRAAIQQQYPLLGLDTREAAEVEELGKRLDVEKELLRQANFENLERRREITKLEADVEEALAGLTLALGREADKKRLYDEIQQKIATTTDNSNKLVDNIKTREDKQ